MASPSLSTLHHVTTRKLSKLATHREKYEANKKIILENVAAAPDTRAKIQALIDGLKANDLPIRQSGLFIKNLERFILQAKHDPSVSTSLLLDWQSKLEQELDIGSVKYEYADLFGRLVTEWIKHPNPAASTMGTAAEDSDVVSDSGSAFDSVGRKEMYEQRKEWEKFVFNEKKMDQGKIEAYLNDIFGTTTKAKKFTKSPLEKLRDDMKEIMENKADHRFDVRTLKSCIQGVLQSDLLAGEKREALSSLQNQPAVLEELVAVLNLDLEAIDDWQWDPVPVPLTMRLQLNGKYRVYMDEEIHQAILLHHIGAVFAVGFKQAFISFYHSGAWLQSPYRSMDRQARQRLEYFVPGMTKRINTVRNTRRNMYQEDFFMTQLKDNSDYTDDGDDSNEGSGNSTQSPMTIKQSMLRMVTAEMILNTKIYDEFTVFQSDFKWFGPSLSHDTIFAVLKFFGVAGSWLAFFKKFLTAPVVFSQDGADAESHTRQCGIPMSHVLSDALSEAVMFCLDFAVNKRTQGANLYRFHDDLWFMGQTKTCVTAWAAIKEFSRVMGLEMNMEKTGSALIFADKTKARPIPASLPEGKIKWGFLVLDPYEGRWVIDRTKVDEHIEELRHQLNACRSVMAWVQAWNSYVTRFFTNNFGLPANCFGREHNDMIIETFSHIQRSLFPDAGTANVTDYLRGVLKERFGTENVPDAFFFYPHEGGGLGIRSPFVGLFTTYEKSLKSPLELIEKAFEISEKNYQVLKENWDSGEAEHRRKPHHFDSAAATDDEPFLSFEEYTRYQEETCPNLNNAYQKMMEAPGEEPIAKESHNQFQKARGAAHPAYWDWIYSLYAADMKQRFGGQGLQLGERDLLPVGLVDVLKSEKVRWDG